MSFNVNVHKRTRTPVCIRIYERICGACVWSWPAYLRLYVYVMSVAVRVSQREHVSGGETDAGWRRVAGPPAGTCRRVRWPEIESIGPFSSKIGLSGFLWPDSTKVYSQNVLEREKMDDLRTCVYPVEGLSIWGEYKICSLCWPPVMWYLLWLYIVLHLPQSCPHFSRLWTCEAFNYLIIFPMSVYHT